MIEIDRPSSFFSTESERETKITLEKKKLSGVAPLFKKKKKTPVFFPVTASLAPQKRAEHVVAVCARLRGAKVVRERGPDVSGEPGFCFQCLLLRRRPIRSSSAAASSLFFFFSFSDHDVLALALPPLLLLIYLRLRWLSLSPRAAAALAASAAASALIFSFSNSPSPLYQKHKNPKPQRRSQGRRPVLRRRRRGPRPRQPLLPGLQGRARPERPRGDGRAARLGRRLPRGRVEDQRVRDAAAVRRQADGGGAG